MLLEDIGAEIGLCFALVGIGLAEITGNARFDAAGTLAIGVLLGVIAVILMIEMKGLLIGESATPEMVAKIRAAMEGDPGVRRVIHMRTQHLGPDELLVGAKLELDTDLDFAAGGGGHRPGRGIGPGGGARGPGHLHRAGHHPARPRLGSAAAGGDRAAAPRRPSPRPRPRR